YQRQHRTKRIIFLALSCLVLLLASCNSGYQQKNGLVTFNGNKISHEKFTLLNEAFGKDDSAAYYKEYAIEAADLATFVALDDHYAKDKNAVYYCDEEREGQNYYLTRHSMIFTIQGAHPASFVLLSKKQDGYAKDRNSAYYNGIAFPVKDVNTLALIDGRFLKDKRQVYYQMRPVAHAVPSSFRVLNDSYARDTDQVYFYGFNGDISQGIHIVPCEAASFSLLDFPYSRDAKTVYHYYNKVPDLHAPGFRAIGNNFSADSGHVFYKTKQLPFADPVSFKLVSPGDGIREEFTYARDEAHVFWEGSYLRGANPATFKLLGLGYSTDGRFVFYHSQQLQRADAASFTSMGHGYGDK
ncbi:MAG: hypothetical protein EOP51_34310, partial [Sphingobacteriales bacterium]